MHGGKTTNRIICASILFFLACLPTLAQTSVPSDTLSLSQLSEQLKQLQQQAQELQSRIASLETKNHPGDASSEITTKNPGNDQQPQASTSSPLPEEWHDLHGLNWRGFGEFDYRVLNQSQPELGTYGFVPGSAGNFYTGDFGLFFTSRISSHASVLAEIIFEEEDAQAYKTDLRRILLNYDRNEHLKLSFGRYQTSIGYYNWAFRSAAWLQTTVDRPLIMEYAENGGLLPTQAIGVSLSGAIPSGKLGLNYVAEYGSADTIRPDINGDGLQTDENNGNHINFAVFARPDSIPGLRMGASYYHDQISNLVSYINGESQSASLPPVPPGVPAQEQSASARWNQTIVNGHLVYTAKGIEGIAEGFLIRHALIDFPAVFDTPAFYAQFSRQWGRIRPFVRYQYVNASPRNLIYDDVGLRFGPSFGSRYDFNDYIAFKAQLDQTARRGEPDLDGLQLQVAFTF